jgi:hypothetical protein
LCIHHAVYPTQDPQPFHFFSSTDRKLDLGYKFVTVNYYADERPRSSPPQQAGKVIPYIAGAMRIAMVAGLQRAFNCSSRAARRASGPPV